MPLRYAQHHVKCKDQPCPCAKVCAPRDRATAFRFVHADATDEADFAPVVVREGSGVRNKCASYALSFFDTLENARKKYAVLAERQDAASRYGDQIAELPLQQADGVATLPSYTTGHFDLHPDDDATFTTRIKKYHNAA